MGYESAVSTILLATHCCVCGKALRDAISVELGIGPECRHGATGGISTAQQEACNRLTHQASIFATQGDIEGVRRVAEEVRALGLPELAEKIAQRFVNAERKAKIVIVASGDGRSLIVETPFKRSASSDFISAWRSIPGRTYRSGKNVIPVESKPALWALLVRFFPGEFGKGPKGLFRLPESLPAKAPAPVAPSTVKAPAVAPVLEGEAELEEEVEVPVIGTMPSDVPPALRGVYKTAGYNS